MLSPTSFIQKPGRWLRAVSDYGATATGGPDFGWDLCVRAMTAEEKVGLDLSRLETAYNCAEPVRSSTLERFYHAFAACGFRREAWFPCFGMAEVTLFVTGGPRNRAPVVLDVDAEALEAHLVRPATRGGPVRSLVGCGRGWEDTRVVIADPETGKRCAPDVVGEIWVASSSVASGYWQRPDETEQAFHAHLQDTGEGPFYRTGDLGFLRGEELFITGRRKDLIILHGRNLYPQDVERTVERVVDFLEPNSCIAVAIEVDGREALALVVEANRALVRKARRIPQSAGAGLEVEAERTLDTLVSRIRAAVADEHEAPVHSVVFVRPGMLPRTTSGKLQRSLCRRRLMAGELEEIHASHLPEGMGANPEPCPGATLGSSNSECAGPGAAMQATIEAAVLAWLARQGKSELPALAPETPFSALGIGSLGMTWIAGEIEARTGARLTLETVYEHPTIGALAAHLTAELPLTSTPIDADSRPFPERYRTANRRFEQWRNEGRYFFHRGLSAQSGAWVTDQGQRLLMLGSYSYLGLLDHPEIIDAACRATREFGTGAHGVRLLAGTTVLHEDLERKLAAFLAAEDALVYSSGFMANLTTISALTQPGDCVIADEWNHASIMDGCRFSGAATLLFRHNDLRALEDCLREAGARQTLVVVDAVFSMQGDVVDLPQVVDLCRRYGAMLMVDEAHSLGVLGRTGRGIQEHFGLHPDDIDVKMGTLSKTIPSAGGYVAGRAELVDYLRHSARGYIFSSALPAPQVAAAAAALDVIQREPQRVSRMWRIRDLYVRGLHSLGFDTLGSTTPIVPIACPSEEATLRMTALCRERGLFVVPVFYPAVPVNAPRLRTCVLASHTEEDIAFALEVLGRAGRSAGLIS